MISKPIFRIRFLGSLDLAPFLKDADFGNWEHLIAVKSGFYVCK